MIRLIATDVDGTLVLPDHGIPTENRDALGEAAGRGVRVALATVRVRATALKIVEALGIPCGLVCQGGATVFDEEGRLLHEQAIPLDLAREIAGFADRHGIGLLTTIDGAHRFGPGYETGFKGVLEEAPRLRTNVEAVDRAPTRFMVTGERGAELLLAEFGASAVRIARHYRRDGTLIDAAVTARGATKEGGLEVLCRHLGVEPEEVLAIGDAESDVGMLRWAGVGVAVGDAPEAVRAEADWVAPPSFRGGVAAAVRRFAAGA